MWSFRRRSSEEGKTQNILSNRDQSPRVSQQPRLKRKKRIIFPLTSNPRGLLPAVPDHQSKVSIIVCNPWRGLHWLSASASQSSKVKQLWGLTSAWNCNGSQCTCLAHHHPPYPDSQHTTKHSSGDRMGPPASASQKQSRFLSKLCCKNWWNCSRWWLWHWCRASSWFDVSSLWNPSKDCCQILPNWKAGSIQTGAGNCNSRRHQRWPPVKMRHFANRFSECSLNWHWIWQNPHLNCRRTTHWGVASIVDGESKARVLEPDITISGLLTGDRVKLHIS